MKIISLRLDEETNLELESRSHCLGIPPAVLARAFVKGGLEGGIDLMGPARLDENDPVVQQAREDVRREPEPAASGRRRRNKKNRGGRR